MVQSTTFRLIITMLTAVCIPLCCCSLESLFRTCDACQGEQAAFQETHDASGDDAAATSADAAGAHERCPCESDQPKPAKKRGDGGCRCGGDKRIGTFEGKTLVPTPIAVLAYILPELAPPRPLREPSISVRSDSRAPLKPDPTLLHQHCALIV